MLKPLAMALSVLMLLPTAVQAELIKNNIDYVHNGDKLQGYLVYDTDHVKGAKKAPGALVYHAWMGIGEHERQWADDLARAGYVVFAPDIYGKGVRPSTPKAAGQESKKYKENPELMRGRALAGLKQLQQQPWVNPDQIGALGFCFGGGVALELARSGAPVNATISLHGDLKTQNPDDAKRITGSVLALHGAADPYVPMKEVVAFQQEMEGANVNWQMQLYGGAVHAFTDPGAGNNPSTGAAYNAVAARRAWNDTLRFLLKNVSPVDA